MDPQHQRFRIRSLEQLRAEIARLGLDLPVAEDFAVLGDSVRVGTHTLANRFAVNPMEGFDADIEGRPQPLSYRRYRRYAEGGAALIWAEATAVVPEGRSNPHQFWIHEGNVDTFAELVQHTKDAGLQSRGRAPVMILQMTHSGRYSKPAGAPKPLIAQHNPILDPIHKLAPDHPLLTDEYLDRLRDAFAKAAELAARAGFDGVGVKSCHRYLLAELHASHTREGRYGGNLENRSRLLRESMARIRAQCPGLIVTTRLNAYDAMEYPYGFGVDRDDWRWPDLTEPLLVIAELRKLGIEVLNVSIGNPYFNPHVNRPYDFPVQGAAPPAEHPLAGVERIVQVVRQVQEANPDLPVIGSGYAWVRQFLPNIAAAVVGNGWATLIGQGRGSFAYPDSVRDILEGEGMDPARCCVTCSGCTQIMRDGGRTGCVVRDSAVYGPEYRQARRFSMDRLLEEAARCRECEEATCSRGCPARIDIPAFIEAFADGDIAQAYAILRERNVLPEMCGVICPVAEQCQGQCLEQIFCERPIPIQDIQLVVAKTARLQGLTGVRLPDEPSGHRVAVVGGGPAGIAATIRLLDAGHCVVLIDKAQALGGTPDTTIPGARYGNARAEVQAALQPALDAGRLTLRLGAAFGAEVTLAGLQNEHDAVLLAMGLDAATSLGQAEGVMDALAFLKAAKAGRLTDIPGRVAVLGGGNTAMDAGHTALELGARDVYLVYRRSFKEMPAWPEERDRFLDAGGHVLLLTQPLGYETDAAGQLVGVRIVRTELGEPDASGRRRPVAVAGSESVLAVELAVEAIGQGLSLALQQALDGVALTGQGLVAADPQTLATSLPGVLAAGDLVNGGTTAVQGITEGMRAADAIGRMLSDRA